MTTHVSKYEWKEKQSQSNKTRFEMRKEEKNRVKEMKVEKTEREERGFKKTNKKKISREKEKWMSVIGEYPILI